MKVWLCGEYDEVIKIFDSEEKALDWIRDATAEVIYEEGISDKPDDSGLLYNPVTSSGLWFEEREIE